MATIDSLTQQMNTLTTKVNSIISNSETITSLPNKAIIDGTEELPINGEEKITTQQITDFTLGNSSLTDLNNTIRKTLTPYGYVSYLPIATPYTTATLTAGTPTKILIPTTVKDSNEWGVADVGGGNLAVQYTGDSTEFFKIFMSTSMTTSVNNVVVNISMYKNGVYEPGVTISRKVGTGSDVGALAVVGEFTADTNDYVEVYVETDLSTTITFSLTSIIITEKN